jgi:hypothetical protein
MFTVFTGNSSLIDVHATLTGLEPATFRSTGGRTDHCATGPNGVLPTPGSPEGPTSGNSNPVEMTRFELAYACLQSRCFPIKPHPQARTFAAAMRHPQKWEGVRNPSLAQQDSNLQPRD